MTILEEGILHFSHAEVPRCLDWACRCGICQAFRFCQTGYPQLSSANREISQGNNRAEMGAVPDELWLRGKKVLWANPEARSVWSSGRTIRNGKVAIPGGRWRPLRVVHLGMELARIRNGQIDRVVGKACQEFSKTLSTGVTDISGDLLDDLLLRKSLTKEEIGISSDISGGHILVSGTDAIPVWVGERVTLMVNDKEVMIRMSQRGLGTDIG